MLNRPFKLIIVAALLFIQLGVAVTRASLESFESRIETPTDGGSGPIVWYQNSRSPNFGNGDPALTLEWNGPITAQFQDFWGNIGGAFGLDATATEAAVIAGSSSTSLATGSHGTVIMTFEGPGPMSAPQSLIGRLPSQWIEGDPKFEMYVHWPSRFLRIITGTAQYGIPVDTVVIEEDVWYYCAVSWDLTLPENQLSWFVGRMGDSVLHSGSSAATVVGDPSRSVRVPGRISYNLFYGAYQNIAIYGRTLSAGAIQHQFGGTLLPPDWWTASGTAIVDPQAPANDPDNYAPVNLGQLKHVALQAQEHLDQNLPGGAGFSISDQWADGVPVEENYTPINVGQLKAIVKPFYDRIYIAGYDLRGNLINRGYPQEWGFNYPWDSSVPVSENYAPANIGQLKMVFSFDVDGYDWSLLDTDGSGIPDWWVTAYGVQQADADADDDAFSNLAKFLMGAEPGTPISSADAGQYGNSSSAGDLLVVLPERGTYLVTDVDGDLVLSGGSAQ